MKKSIKGFKIAMIKIVGKDNFIDVCNSEGESIKTTREQRNVILNNYKHKDELIRLIKKTFNNPGIIDDDVIIKVDK